ncbi:uncharacterized protein [Apostichopus japonicus]|uniref:uncharacterized protein isoform X2 n=1 Tax=Stichopus japonicus TaxID=307972 RepID=UPI003AB1CF90
MDSAHSENRPSNYDSGDEWEIGLGNLIIDLDADLEKDKQDGTSTKNGSGDSSPLRIGKMKIKRKVSSLKGDYPSSDSKEACSSLENNDSAKPEDIASHSPSKGFISKSWTMKGAVAGRDSTKGDGSNEQRKEGTFNEGITIKTGTKSVESREVTTGKLGKNSEKPGDDVKKKEVGKRSSDGNSSRKPSGKRPKLDKSSSCSIGVDTMDMGTITEPESLGPCEPGTAVTLEGIVWHENDQGVLVVNVTWRNKTYVGTLLDCSQHNWAPPRFCDSPTSDIESRQTKSSSRSKRGRSTSNTSQDKYTDTRSSMHSKLRNSTMAKGRRTSNSSSTGRKTPPTSSEKITSAGKRKIKSSDVDAAGTDDTLPSVKRTKSSHKVANSDMSLEKNPDGLIACPEPNCNKKYKHINGLRYHKMHAHLNQTDESSALLLKGRTGDQQDHGNTFKKPREEKCVKQGNGKCDQNRLESPGPDKAIELKEELLNSSQVEISNNKEEVQKDDQNPSTITACVCKDSLNTTMKTCVCKDSQNTTKTCVCKDSQNTTMKTCVCKDSQNTTIKSCVCKDGQNTTIKACVCKDGQNTSIISAGLCKTDGENIAIIPTGVCKKDSLNTIIIAGVSKEESRDSTSSPAGVVIDVPNKKSSTEESPRKPVPTGTLTSNADLSVFDFNPTLEEETEASHTSKPKLHSPEKISISHQRPSTQFPESTVSKSESPDSIDNVNSKETIDSSQDKKLEKDKSKGEKHKRREKSLLKPLKSTRPIAPAPPLLQQQQLIAIPISATIVKPGTIAPTQATTVTVTTMPAVTTKLSSVSGSNLKPIQPKPTVMGEASTVNPTLVGLKEKKQKIKKKKDKEKLSKDKERKEKKPEKQPCDQSISESGPSEAKPKVAFISPVPETNILKHALTSSVSPLELLSPSMANQIPSTGNGPMCGQPPNEPSTKNVPKPFSVQLPVKPVGLTPSSSAIPEIPKLISVTQTINTSLPPYSTPTAHLPETRTNNAAVSTSVITKTVQSSIESISSIPALEALSIGTDPNRSAPTSNLQSAAADCLDTLRKTSSPAYSDISDEGGDSQSIIFHTAKESRIVHNVSVKDHFKMSSLSLLRGNLENDRKMQPTACEAQHLNDSLTTGVMKPEESLLARTEEGDSTRQQYNGQFNAVSSYFQLDSMQHGKGLHNYKHQYSEQSRDSQQEADKLGAGLNMKNQGSRCSDLVEIKTITDPKDKTSLRIHSELDQSSQRDLERTLLVPENIPSSQTRNQDSTPERKNLHTVKEHRDIVKKSCERKTECSRSTEVHREPSGKEERREYSTGQESRLLEQRSTTASKPDSDMRPPSHGNREKSCRSVSPGYRNSNWEEKARYSASPSRSKSDRASERLQSPQNGVHGYPNASYLHNPYMQYGPMAYDPSHPAFNPSHPPFTSLVAYPSILPPEVPYSTTHPHWQGSETKDRSAITKDSPSSSSSSTLSIPSTSRTSEAHERPTKALDMFAPGSDSYSRHRPRSGSPDRTTQRAASSSAPKASSPLTSKSPPRPAGPPQESRADMARRHDAYMLHQQQMLHQHMHTHQHTHLGMASIGFPGILPQYDPYGIANHQAASGVNPYAVRRE